MTKGENNPRAAIFTVGCKLNQADSACLEALLAEAGYESVSFGEPADVTVVNTCTVTGTADFKSRQKIRQARKLSPDGVVVVTGCYAQRDPDAISALGCVDLLLDNRNKFEIVGFLKSLSGKGMVIDAGSGGGRTIHPDVIPSFSSHTRAFVKIQDGCDGVCSYCIVPMVRGGSASRPSGSVITEVRHLRERGFNEIVLTGVNIGNYRDPGSGAGISALVREILAMDILPRLRLSSIEPLYFDRELIDLVADEPGLCPHFHVPLQSGDGGILRMMRRGYSIEEFCELIEAIASRIEDVSIGTDVIVGFPGEGEREFEGTFHRVSDLPFSYLHVFPYSPREGTAATGMTGSPSPAVIHERADRLRDLGMEKNVRYRERFVGRTLDVLFEGGATGRGLSANYIRITAPGKGLANRLLPVWIRALTPDGLEGALLQDR